MPFNHKIYFDSVREDPFGGSLSQEQVDGQEAILTGWERHLDGRDIRFLAYMLATTYHETAASMQPIEEYHGSQQPYGKPDPETGECYYGRGFVQLTHRDNYARADEEAGWEGDDSCEYHADNALDLQKAGRIMWFGMSEGWFRADDKGPHTLSRYFSNTHDNAYDAREIINGDKKTVPGWSNGVSIGNLVKGYHEEFLSALYDARIEAQPSPDAAAAAQAEGADDPQDIAKVATPAPKGVQNGSKKENDVTMPVQPPPDKPDTPSPLPPVNDGIEKPEAPPVPSDAPQPKEPPDGKPDQS
jgi:hypothetical protein